MRTVMTPEQLNADLTEQLQQHPAVQTALLFGSHAAGRARADSDLDVAVWLGAARNDVDAEEFRLTLSIALMARYGCPVDLVLLDQAPPFLKLQVFNRGIELFVRDPDGWRAFRAKGYIEALDFRHIMDIQFAADKKRIRERLAHGE